MKKKRIRVPVSLRALLKLWKIMRLSVFFLLLFVAQTFATVTYSQQTRLTLKMQGAKVIDVLSKIEDESEFFFLFNQKLVNVERQVNVDVKNESVEKILSNLFENTNVSYLVKDRQIVLTTADLNAASEQDQRITISGKVSDTTGNPIPGVSVVVKGTTNGTSTDRNGNYTLIVPGNAIVQFSFVGMKSEEIAIAGRTSVNVTLTEETIGLDEVVAIGYGTVKKADLTGAVSVVKADEFKNVAVLSVSNAIQGLVSGVNIRSSGGIGSEPVVESRGLGNFTNKNPL